MDLDSQLPKPISQNAYCHFVRQASEPLALWEAHRRRVLTQPSPLAANYGRFRKIPFVAMLLYLPDYGARTMGSEAGEFACGQIMSGWPAGAMSHLEVKMCAEIGD